ICFEYEINSITWPAGKQISSLLNFRRPWPNGPESKNKEISFRSRSSCGRSISTFNKFRPSIKTFLKEWPNKGKRGKSTEKFLNRVSILKEEGFISNRPR